MWLKVYFERIKKYQTGKPLLYVYEPNEHCKFHY